MKKFLALFVASAITALTIAAPTQPTTPILNGKLLNPLDANGFRIDNLDTSNLNIPGGGGGTPLTDLTLNVPVALFSNPVNFNIVGGSVAGTMSLATQAAGTVFANATGSTAAPSWVTLSTFKSAAGLNLVDNTSDASKPISTATQAGLDLKEGITAHDADIAAANAAIALKANTTTVNDALALKAATTYVDSSIANFVGTTNLNTLGTVTTGTWNATSIASNKLPTLNNIAAPTAPVSLNAQRIVLVADPTGAADAANKEYVDAVASTGPPHPAAAVASTGNLTLSGEQTVDGVLTSASRILVKNQSTAANNGIYVTAAGAWARASDANADAEVSGSVFVSGGSVNGGTTWGLTTPQPLTLGTDDLTYTQTGANTIYSATGGVQLQGAQFSLSPLTAPGKLMGRYSAGAGSPQEITISTGLTLDGSGNLTSAAGLSSFTTGNLSPIFTAGLGSSPTTAPALAFSLTPAAAFTFFGNGTAATVAPTYMTSAAARNALSGGNTVGASLLTIVDPNALRYMRIKTDNTIELMTGGAFVTGVGAEPALGNPASNGQVVASTTLGVRSFVSKENPLTLSPSGIFSRVGDTITLAQADTSHDGYLTQGNWTTFNGKENVLSFGTPLLRGTGPTANNITISVANGNASPPTSGYLLAADWSSFNSKVPGGRTLTPIAPVRIDGTSGSAVTLGADRTIDMLSSTNTRDGYLSSADHLIFAAAGPNTALAGLGGTMTVATPVPPINRILLNQVLTSNLNIVLPPALNYASTVGFEPIEIVDAIGGAMANFGVTVQKSGSDTIDGVGTPIPIPRNSTYFRIGSNGLNKWYTTKFSATSFSAPTSPLKNVLVDVSAQPDNANYIFRPASVGDSVSVTPLGVQARTYLNSIGTTGAVGADTISPTDLTPNLETVTGTNVSDTVITADGSIDTVRLNTGLDGLRRFVWPKASDYLAGHAVRFIDNTGSLTTSNFVRVVSNNFNTFNGNPSIDLTENYFNRTFVADPVTGNWTVSTFGGTGGGLNIDPIWHGVAPVSGLATLICSPNVVENHHVVTMNAGITLAISGAIPGSTGRIKFIDSSGNHTVTVPNAHGFTPSAGGTGLFTTSTGAPVTDEYDWDFDGTDYTFRPNGLNLVAAAAASYGATDVNTTGLSHSSYVNQGISNSFKYGVATRLLADGGVTNGSSYTIGKVRLRLLRAGSVATPAWDVRVKIMEDSAGAPSSQNGSASDPVNATSGLATSEGDVDFNPVSTVVGKRNQSSISIVNTSTTITGASNSFQPGDVGCNVIIASGTGTIPINATILSVAAGGASAVISGAATVNGTATISLQHVYWIVLYGNNTGIDANSYVSMSQHAPSVGNATYRSQTGGTWSQIGNSIQVRYTTFRQ